MALLFNNTRPNTIIYAGNDVKRVIYNGVTVWEKNTTVTYSVAGPQVTLQQYPSLDWFISTGATAANPGTGTYKYTVRIPYCKTANEAFTNNNGLAITLTTTADTNTTLIDFGTVDFDPSVGMDVRYVTATVTSNVWYGNNQTLNIQIRRKNSNNAASFMITNQGNYTLTITDAT